MPPALTTTKPTAPGVLPSVFSCLTASSGSDTRISLAGDLDIATAPEVERALSRAEADVSSVILDLRELEFMGCCGAHLMLAADSRLRAAGRRLLVVRGGPDVEWFCTLIGLDRRLEFVDHPPAFADLDA